jgi:hypothetical protein
VDLAERLDIADQVTHLAGLELIARPALRGELTELEHRIF